MAPASSLLRKVPRWSTSVTSGKDTRYEATYGTAVDSDGGGGVTSDLDNAPLFLLASAAVPLAGDSEVNFDFMSICGSTVVSLVTRLVAAAVSSVSSPRRNDIFSRTLHLLQ